MSSCAFVTAVFYISRQVVIHRGNHQHVFSKTTPEIFRFPGAIHNFLNGFDVMRSPVITDREHVCIRCKLAHIRCLTNGFYATLFSGHQWCWWVGMLNQHVNALIDQSIGGFAFFNRIIPGAYPHDFDFYIRINGFSRHIYGVDIADNFRNRERSNVTNGVGFGHHAGSDTGNIATFISTQYIGREVFGALVTGCVLKEYFWKTLGDFFSRVHKTEGGGENQIMTALRHLTDHAFGIGAFRYFLNKGGFDFVAEEFLRFHTTTVMLIRTSHNHPPGQRTRSQLSSDLRPLRQCSDPAPEPQTLPSVASSCVSSSWFCSKGSTCMQAVKNRFIANLAITWPTGQE